jgi:hypothetical protein
MIFAFAVAFGGAERGAAGGDPCVYGTYSLGTKHASSFRERATELRELGGDFIVGLRTSHGELDQLPRGIRAAPGCSLIKPSQWRDEASARQRLGELATKFAHHPSVWGVCLSHEVDEFADHNRRAAMYRMAKSFFPGKRVFFYYARVPEDYGLRGEVESDVLFYELNPFDKEGDFDLSRAVRKLERGLAVIDRTPGIPLWGQTSVNADHRYVTGPETMRRTWGSTGENMLVEAQELFSHGSPAGTRLSGFFWRSLGRFDWDLGYPAFAAHRHRVREIAERRRCS